MPNSQNDFWKLHANEGFPLGVRCDTPGQPTLRSVAISVRRTWPPAWILILRHVESGLEGHLHDEIIDSPFRHKELLGALVKLADDPLNQRPKLFAANSGTAWSSDPPVPSSPSKPLESDPTKADPHYLDAEKEYSPDIPGDEQCGQRA
jgi:hypothetical protein